MWIRENHYFEIETSSGNYLQDCFEKGKDGRRDISVTACNSNAPHPEIETDYNEGDCQPKRHLSQRLRFPSLSFLRKQESIIMDSHFRENDIHGRQTLCHDSSFHKALNGIKMLWI
ncbi:MAG: hypothetical protein A3I04_05690 [Nitrospinae bacterium RIFCSPLOWO2_02_FULL_39_110]|nr:MAG: hypothetical protein A3D97_03960 [Nitrospinae bacterium RIFCSPHIGHO2_12_FULL_39_42]OGV99862.1 MAG: hypothetical protein A3D20_05385 [Nitrospinae bacterium RIFCSPHIGHO2_02_FULL_39_82]OGW02894.1 MAG: hypothetical protein A2Z59_03400 [Nitrospinae bacterium RIFCSPLOWO2_02_39_17]OGW05873.1 MAG: hypothetical protein A3I04_05690 [Nitrospinae bacterium RIFCSPLOWO2_02_FULL_39_110]OGW11369.1 MAG: hypothetical protein A2W75_09355 [Nitrospinae bacterium RIFCSPLOWO2_12_39_15]OGW11417.1 MAG: hypothe